MKVRSEAGDEARLDVVKASCHMESEVLCPRDGTNKHKEHSFIRQVGEE
jgi:hypothetical protein